MMHVEKKVLDLFLGKKYGPNTLFHSILYKKISPELNFKAQGVSNLFLLEARTRPLQDIPVFPSQDRETSERGPSCSSSVTAKSARRLPAFVYYHNMKHLSRKKGRWIDQRPDKKIGKDAYHQKETCPQLP